MRRKRSFLNGLYVKANFYLLNGAYFETSEKQQRLILVQKRKEKCEMITQDQRITSHKNTSKCIAKIVLINQDETGACMPNITFLVFQIFFVFFLKNTVGNTLY